VLIGVEDDPDVLLPEFCPAFDGLAI